MVKERLTAVPAMGGVVAPHWRRVRVVSIAGYRTTAAIFCRRRFGIWPWNVGHGNALPRASVGFYSRPGPLALGRGINAPDTAHAPPKFDLGYRPAQSRQSRSNPRL